MHPRQLLNSSYWEKLKFSQNCDFQSLKYLYPGQILTSCNNSSELKNQRSGKKIAEFFSSYFCTPFFRVKRRYSIFIHIFSHGFTVIHDYIPLWKNIAYWIQSSPIIKLGKSLTDLFEETSKPVNVLRANFNCFYWDIKC